MKTIFILLVIYLGYVIIKGFVAKGGLRPTRGHRVAHGGPSAGERGGGGAKEGEEMLQDPVCLSYVPISSAVILQGEQGEVYFCSDECRDRYRAEGGARPQAQSGDKSVDV